MGTNIVYTELAESAVLDGARDMSRTTNANKPGLRNSKMMAERLARFGESLVVIGHAQMLAGRGCRGLNARLRAASPAPDAPGSVGLMTEDEKQSGVPGLD
jgi:hypothetical protein